MIRAIIFDCYGVLYREAVEELLDRCAPEWQSLAYDTLKGYRHGFLEEETVAERFALYIGESRERVRELLERGMVRNELLMRQIVERKFDGKVALMSNIGRAAMDRIMAVEERERLFDGVFLSSELGVSKPDEAIYMYASSALGVLPRECLLIDDSEANVAGARAAGMQGIVFTSMAQLQGAMAKLNVVL